MSEIVVAILKDHKYYKKVKILRSNEEVLACNDKVVFIEDPDLSKRSSPEYTIDFVAKHFWNKLPERPYTIPEPHSLNDELYIFSTRIYDICFSLTERTIDTIHNGDLVIGVCRGSLSDTVKRRISRAALKSEKIEEDTAWGGRPFSIYLLTPDERRTRIDTHKEFVESYPKKSGAIRLRTLQDLIRAIWQNFIDIVRVARREANLESKGYASYRDLDRPVMDGWPDRVKLIALLRAIVNEASKKEGMSPTFYRKIDDPGSRIAAYKAFLMEVKAALPKIDKWVEKGDYYASFGEEKDKEVRSWFAKFCRKEVADSVT